MSKVSLINDFIRQEENQVVHAEQTVTKETANVDLIKEGIPIENSYLKVQTEPAEDFKSSELLQKIDTELLKSDNEKTVNFCSSGSITKVKNNVISENAKT